MAYIGQRAAGTTAQSRTLDTMTGDGSTNTLTLSQTPDSVMNVTVYYDGVMQRPDVEYTLSGNTLTFTTAPESGVVVYAMTGGAEDIGSPMVGSVTLDTIVDNAITNNKIVSMSSSKLTGALPALDGSNLTGLSSTIDTKSANDPAIDTNPSAVGHLWANTTSGEMFVCTDNTAGENVWYNIGGGSGDVEPFHGAGLISGYVSGRANTPFNTIEKYSFTSDGNATDHGDLPDHKGYCAGNSSSTHGYNGGGNGTGMGPVTNFIYKFAFGSNADGTDVADLTVARVSLSGNQSTTHGYFSNGYGTSSYARVIDKHAYASDANATDVGDPTIDRSNAMGTTSKTHGYAAGGNSPYLDVIDKWSFSVDGDATDVGNLTLGRNGGAGNSSQTHGYVSAGFDGVIYLNIIEKWTYASDADATDVGDVFSGHDGNGQCGQSSSTHGHQAGAIDANGVQNHISKFTFASDANGTDVGDLVTSGNFAAGHQY